MAYVLPAPVLFFLLIVDVITTAASEIAEVLVRVAEPVVACLVRQVLKRFLGPVGLPLQLRKGLVELLVFLRRLFELFGEVLDGLFPLLLSRFKLFFVGFVLFLLGFSGGLLVFGLLLRLFLFVGVLNGLVAFLLGRAQFRITLFLLNGGFG